MKLTVDCADCGRFSLSYEPGADPRTVGWGNRRRGALCPVCVAAESSRRVVGIPRVRADTEQSMIVQSIPDTPEYVQSGFSEPEYRDVLTSVQVQPERVPKEITESRVGGAGGRGTKPQNGPRVPVVRPLPPAELADFDEALSRWPGYHPTTKFYERLMERYISTPTPGLDIVYEAEGMVDWLRLHPNVRHDIPRFAERWLIRAKDDALRSARQWRPTGTQTPGANGQRWKMGATNVSAEERKAAEEMRRRGREHYDS